MSLTKKISLLSALSLFISACGEKDTLVTIRTPYGDMKAILYDSTKQHKDNFLALARSKAYDSTFFHRVINGFMVQGGDVNLKKGVKSKIEYTIPAEFFPQYFHKKGALAAARMGDQVNPERASSGCQFYIAQGKVYMKEELNTDVQKLSQEAFGLFQDERFKEQAEKMQNAYIQGNYDEYTAMLLAFRPTVEAETGKTFEKKEKMPEERMEAYSTVGGVPHLDDEYTVFGQVVEGLEVIDKIAAVKTGQADRPVEDIYMTIELEEVSKEKLAKRYGIDYANTSQKSAAQGEDEPTPAPEAGTN